MDLGTENLVMHPQDTSAPPPISGPLTVAELLAHGPRSAGEGSTAISVLFKPELKERFETRARKLGIHATTLLRIAIAREIERVKTNPPTQAEIEKYGYSAIRRGTSAARLLRMAPPLKEALDAAAAKAGVSVALLVRLAIIHAMRTIKAP